MAIKVEWHPAGTGGKSFNSRRQDEVVVDALPEGRGVKAAVTATANRVAAGARSNAVSVGGSRDTQRLGRLVAEEIGVKPVKPFRRKRIYPNTKTTVALVVSDSLFSQLIEYGSGGRVSMTRFMRSAAGAAASKGVTFKARGRR